MMKPKVYKAACCGAVTVAPVIPAATGRVALFDTDNEYTAWHFNPTEARALGKRLIKLADAAESASDKELTPLADETFTDDLGDALVVSDWVFSDIVRVTGHDADGKIMAWYFSIREAKRLAKHLKKLTKYMEHKA